ncbi:lipid-transfer protein [Chloroflexota bacterium]
MTNKLNVLDKTRIGKPSEKGAGPLKEVAIIGIGMHPWGKFEGKNLHELMMDATKTALKDANMDWRDIQLICAGEDPWGGVLGMLSGSQLQRDMGWLGIPVFNSYAACATGGYALRTAQLNINAGICDIALCVAGSISPKGAFGPTTIREFDPNDLDTQRFRILGYTNPTGWAFTATRRMHLYGTTMEDLALVKVKNSKHGSLNPLARYRKVYTIDEVLNSPMVVHPLTLFQICATSDGAAAVIVCSLEKARRYTNKPITIAGIGLGTPTYPDAEVYWFGQDYSATEIPDINARGKRAAARAYEEAGLGPEDLSLAEVYDLASIRELEWYEDIGLCKPGEAEKLLRDGSTSIGGRIPVNPSGGCSSFGEAIPAQALSQVCELTWQLRGQTGQRQVENAKVGFSINAGKHGNASAIIAKR